MIKIFCIFIIFIFQSFSNYITITSPKNLANKFPHRLNFDNTDFGFNPYGKLIKGSLEYLEHNQNCPRIQKRKAQFLLIEEISLSQCDEYSYQYFEKLGYSMIIIHNKLSFLDIYQADRPLKIPIIEIYEKASQDLIDQIILYDIDIIEIEAFFNPPNKSQILEIKYWMDLIDENSYNFLESFKEISDSIENQFTFQPRFPIYSDPIAELNNFTYDVGHCLSNGRYCLSYSIYDEKSYQTRQALEEVIRSICVSQLKPFEIWLEYELQFNQLCIQQMLFGDFERCSYYILEALEIGKQQIQKCYQDSFTFDTDGTGFFNWERQVNTLLEDQIQARKDYDIYHWPTLSVNGLVYQGDLTSYNSVQEFLCEGFIDSYQPAVCDYWDQWNINSQNLQPLTYKKHFFNNHYYYLIGTIVVLIIILLIYKFFKRSVQIDVQKEIAMQVNSSVSQYWQFKEQNSGKQSIDTDASDVLT